jgi:hypothetical protein
VAWQVRGGGVGVMLFDLVREGEQIAAACRSSKFVKGVKAWSRSVEEHLKDDPVALTRFRNAQPISGTHPDIAAAAANHWKKLQGQLAVLSDLARRREQEEVFALSPTVWGLGVSLKNAGRKVREWWWRTRRSS